MTYTRFGSARRQFRFTQQRPFPALARRLQTVAQVVEHAADGCRAEGPARRGQRRRELCATLARPPQGRRRVTARERIDQRLQGIPAVGLPPQVRASRARAANAPDRWAAPRQFALTNLASRGLRTDRSLLVIVEGAKALGLAVTQTFGRAAVVQRCQVHKCRNILEHLPEAQAVGEGDPHARLHQPNGQGRPADEHQDRVTVALNTDTIQTMRLEQAEWGRSVSVAAVETIEARMRVWRDRGRIGEPPFSVFEAARLLRVGSHLEQTARGLEPEGLGELGGAGETLQEWASHIEAILTEPRADEPIP